MISKKGFTLIEVLLVITIMAIISIAALTSTVTIQKQFVFINTFKESLSKIREARLYAVTQKAVNLGGGKMGIPSSYGVLISVTGGKIEIKVFADLANSTTPNGYDAKDILFGSPYILDPEKYQLVVLADQSPVEDPLSMPDNFEISGNNSLTLLYPPSGIKVEAIGKKDEKPTSFPDPAILLKLTDKSNTKLVKTMSIFIRSGIAEEINPGA